MVSWQLGAEAFKLARSERSELVHLVKAQLDPIEKNLRQVRRTNEQTERLIALDAKALLPIKRPSSTLVRPKPVPNLFEPDLFADCDPSNGGDSDFSDGLVAMRRVSAVPPTGSAEIVEDDETDSLLSSLKESLVLEDDGSRTLMELTETASNLLAEIDLLITSVLAQSALLASNPMSFALRGLAGCLEELRPMEKQVHAMKDAFTELCIRQNQMLSEASRIEEISEDVNGPPESPRHCVITSINDESNGSAQLPSPYSADEPAILHREGSHV